MGSLLESLWGYQINLAVRNLGVSDFEIAWFPEHQYHDFAVVSSVQNWNPLTKFGEHFRIEAKSMQVGEGVDEPKAHFNVLQRELDQNDAILLIVWKWAAYDKYRVHPEITGVYFKEAHFIATLRDELHIIRGGSFVSPGACPDLCYPQTCSHIGEPLNASGKRERASGPTATRVSRQTSHAANFGGMLRMLKSSSKESSLRTRQIIRTNFEYCNYLDFIHTHFENEERVFYFPSEWKGVASALGIDPKIPELHRFLRARVGREKYKHLLPL